MKYLIVLMLIISTPAYAEKKSTNTMIKECLEVFGYDYNAPVEKRLNEFDWRNASDCVSAFNIEKQRQKIAEYKAFLKENPWYKGKNWKWTERAEYTCTKQYHTGLTVCHKPIYIN